jgi:hypothetical protein
MVRLDPFYTTFISKGASHKKVTKREMCIHLIFFVLNPIVGSYQLSLKA